jgi:RimJ/RimL family protein N-acetyltransferase/catechol 2,3-dioxygenase-like lactoylglutathione lyase family enzyme
MRIETKSLALVAQTPDDVRAQIERMSAADRAEISPVWLERARAATTIDPWTLGFVMILPASDIVVGSCGFKGPPDADGVVEIAYGVDPVYRGRGYATEAAAALVEFAFATSAVRLVRAHTISDSNASSHVLTRCGFDLVGPVIDPEDGQVWRWQRSAIAGPRPGQVLALAHVQLAMPAGQEDVARAFYCDVLGFVEEIKPPHLRARGGAWFHQGDAQLHLGVERAFRPARKAHPALLVRGLAAIVERCRRAGFPPVVDEPLDGFDRVYVSDPFGNRIELMEPLARP